MKGDIILGGVYACMPTCMRRALAKAWHWCARRAGALNFSRVTEAPPSPGGVSCPPSPHGYGGTRSGILQETSEWVPPLDSELENTGVVSIGEYGLGPIIDADLVASLNEFFARCDLARAAGGISEGDRQFSGVSLPPGWWLDTGTYYWLPPEFRFGPESVQ